MVLEICHLKYDDICVCADCTLGIFLLVQAAISLGMFYRLGVTRLYVKHITDGLVLQVLEECEARAKDEKSFEVSLGTTNHGEPKLPVQILLCSAV